MMKSRLLLLITFLIGLSAWGLNAQAAFKQSVTLENENFIAERIPLTLDGDTPIAEMEIGGKKARFIVDTGADSVTVKLKTATLETLQVRYLDSQERSADISGKVTRTRRFIIPDAKLGGLRFTDLTAAEEIRDYVGLDGLIGNALLRHFYVLFDYSASQMVLYPKTAYPDELDLSGWAKVPFRHNDIGIIVNGRLGNQGRKLKFCLDTGCTITYQEKKLGIIRSKFVPPPERTGSIRMGLNQTEEKEYPSTKTDSFYVEDLNLGPLEFMVFDYKQPPVDGFIGGNVFVNYKVFIDFDHQVLFFKKP